MLSGGTGGRGRSRLSRQGATWEVRLHPKIGVLKKIGGKVIFTVPVFSFNLTRRYNPLFGPYLLALEEGFRLGLFLP